MMNKQFPVVIKPIHFLVNIDVFKVSVVFSVNETDQQLKSNLGRLRPVIEEDIISVVNLDNSDGICKDLGNHGSCLIRLKSLENKGGFMSTVSHEIFHAVHNIAHYRGLKLTNSSEETYAYMIGYLTKEFYKKVKI